MRMTLCATHWVGGKRGSFDEVQSDALLPILATHIDKRNPGATHDKYGQFFYILAKFSPCDAENQPLHFRHIVHDWIQQGLHCTLDHADLKCATRGRSTLHEDARNREIEPR